MTDTRVLLFDADDRVLLEPWGLGWKAPAAATSPVPVSSPVWSRDDLVYTTAVIAPEAAPSDLTWWTLGGLLAERPPLEQPELIDLIRRQLPSCFA